MTRGEAGDRGRTVLYIGGWGRSGSTLVERVLGQVDGFASVGEVRELWQRGLVENRPCGCGQAFHECPFWTEVGHRAYGGWDQVDRAEVLGLRYRLDRGWSFPLLAARRPRGETGRSLERYAGILEPLYRAIFETSGAGVVVDASKLPSHALILRRVPGIDLRMVHLVRDSRGVAFSWQKLVRSGSSGQDPKFLERYNPVAASARYDLYNSLTRRVGRMGVPYLRLRYEDFVAEPRASVAGILRHVDVDPGRADLSFLQNGHAQLGTNHTVDGNPMRFSVGAVTIRADEQWRSQMSGADRFWVTTLTAPLLRGYGYRARARSGGRDGGTP